MLDVVHEFVPVVLEEALHRQRRGVAQRADRAARDVVGHRVQRVEVFIAPLAVLDAASKRHGIKFSKQRIKAGAGHYKETGVAITEADMVSAEKADAIFNKLMGSEVEPRKNFIQTHAKFVKGLDV